MAKTFRAQEARQGRNGRRVLVILICGIALALAAWAITVLVVPRHETPVEQVPSTATLPAE